MLIKSISIMTATALILSSALMQVVLTSATQAQIYPTTPSIPPPPRSPREREFREYGISVGSCYTLCLRKRPNHGRTIADRAICRAKCR
jgi:hypothetical protein